MTETSVPFVDLSPQYEALHDEIRAAVDRVFASRQFILGEHVASFEEQLGAWIGLESGGVVGVSSGTDALLASLMALGVKPGDEVLTTPFSFFATAGVIARLGAKPVFADIDPKTFNLDPKHLESLDPSRFKAVIVVHLYGRCADLDAIRAWADPADVPVVEDAAQAIGARWADGLHAGMKGAMGCFSFFPTKNLGAAGDGGCIVTTDDRLLEDLRRIRVHGAVRAYESQVIGGNFRLDAIQAAILEVKLGHLNDWTNARVENARYYDQRLREAGLADTLSLPDIPDSQEYIAHQYVVRSSNREALRDHLAKDGIGTAIYYPMTFHLMPCFAGLGYQVGDYPEAERAAQEAVALPIFAELGRERQDRVIQSLVNFLS